MGYSWMFPGGPYAGPPGEPPLAGGFIPPFGEGGWPQPPSGGWFGQAGGAGPPAGGGGFLDGLQSAVKGINQTMGLLNQFNATMKQFGPMVDKLFGPPPAPAARVRVKSGPGRRPTSRVRSVGASSKHLGGRKHKDRAKTFLERLLNP